MCLPTKQQSSAAQRCSGGVAIISTHDEPGFKPGVARTCVRAFSPPDQRRVFEKGWHSMYAIIAESGGQRQVRQGDEFLTDLVEAGNIPVGKQYTVTDVLLIGDAGGQAKIGQPNVQGASVTLEVTEAVVMGPKLYIQYFQAKKGSRRRTGHRQRFTKVKVVSIKG